jgi:chlorite dismutase
VSIHSFVEWLDTFSCVLRPADVTVKEVNHIRCFAIHIAKDIMLLSCRFAMEHLCALQLETTLATLVTTWFTLADRRWNSRYRSSDQCILNASRSPERYNGWFMKQLRQRFTFFNFFPMMMDNAWNFL